VRNNATPEDVITGEFSDDINLQLKTISIFESNPPGIDIFYNRFGVITYTKNPDDPITDLLFEAKIIDYDGIASDGSTHTVEVKYPNGTIKTMDFQYRNADGISAVYQWYDADSNPADYPDDYSGDYIFRVTDSEGDWSEAIDYLSVIPINPPMETTFLPVLTPAQSIRAYFDDVCPYDGEGNIDPEGCDNFESGIDPTDWNPYPANVYPMGGEVVIENIGSLGQAPTWLNTNNIPQDGSPLDFKATVRLDDGDEFNSNEPMARIAGSFCRVGNSDIFAMVGIRKDDAVYAVAKTRWEGDHFIVENLVPVTPFSPGAVVTPGNRYDIRLQWDGSSIFNFFVVGLDGDEVDYQDSVDLNDHFDPLAVTAPQNAWAGLGVATWNRLDTTTPEFDWETVTGATYYRVRIYGLNNNTIYRGYTQSTTFQLPPGVLKPNAAYKYRIETCHRVHRCPGPGHRSL